MNAPAQIENADSPVARHELAQREVDGFPLGRRPDESLSLVQYGIVDVDIRTHTHDHTPIDV